jgi:hypothetical protein
MKSNIVPFPVCVRERSKEGGWWYAGKKYDWVGEVKKLVTDREWRRIYERDLLRHVREMERGGNSAA